MIQPTTKREKLSECENEDRLSDLSDCIILHILSSLNVKNTVQTCVLSSRWKTIWKHLPALILHSSNFPTLKIFTKFVSRILSLRDSSIPLQALDFDRNGIVEPHMIKRVVDYAISHNVQRLGLDVQCEIEKISHSIFSCQSLTYLKLFAYPRKHREVTLFPKTLNLPALTTLHLRNFAFCVDYTGQAEPFSAFSRLNSLFLCNCVVKGALTLCISSATLVNLTLHTPYNDLYVFRLCTPSLWTFSFAGSPLQSFSRNSLSSVKHVSIDANMTSKDLFANASLFLLIWLQGLANITSLTVSATTLQILSSDPNLSKMKLHLFSKLKSLKIKMTSLECEFCQTLLEGKSMNFKSMKEDAKLLKAFEKTLEPTPSIPDGILNFLIQSSPLAEVEIIDYPWRKM